MPTSKEEMVVREKRGIEEELARLKRNRDRRIARAKQQGINTSALASMGPPTPLGETPPSVGSPLPVATSKKDKTPTYRKCSACGQVGHVKTNSKCPLFAQTAAAEGWDPR